MVVIIIFYVGAPNKQCREVLKSALLWACERDVINEENRAAEEKNKSE